MGRQHRRHSIKCIAEARDVSVLGEAAHIVERARHHATVVVTLGPLLFFSSDTGDAWVLDPEDSLARCLARDGTPLPAGITETAHNFSVEWTANYRINGNAIVFIERSGQVGTVIGYPVTEISGAIRRMRAGA